MDLLQTILLKVKTSLRNQKALYKNQKVITTLLSISTFEDPLTLLSLSENDSEYEIVGTTHLSWEDLGDEDDNGAVDGDEEDEDDKGEKDEEGGDDDEEESNC